MMLAHGVVKRSFLRIRQIIVGIVYRFEQSPILVALDELLCRQCNQTASGDLLMSDN